MADLSRAGRRDGCRAGRLFALIHTVRLSDRDDIGARFAGSPHSTSEP